MRVTALNTRCPLPVASCAKYLAKYNRMSDIEDLAAQVGIEILPSSTSGQLIASKTAQSADGDLSSAENKGKY